MRLNEVVFTDAKPVDGYGPGFFRIGGEVFKGPLVVTSTGVASWGGFDDADALIAMKDKTDVVFIGTGENIAYIPAELRTALETAGVAFETMASPAACRTFNVLLSEGRRVALAILPI
ncbi:hypothetical protein BVC71_03985 [Marivivens niveibacter]|uniref:Mth938-like domain-containing protein n=1 Tax=Marivivens niveibacter TaxID=1930667 RepID=A0A251X1U0_9RHOB|nr:Mth938-like domain-containing protein [Marivivens niveibacter]OUD10657.1 hypothetical protein BVC71_03985 [Marivivens niveibacter]